MMTQNDTEKTIPPRELANKFELKIRGAVAKKFASDERYLSLLEDEDGVYWSQEEPGTLCCLVVGEKDGHLYLVTSRLAEDGKNLSDFKCDVIS